MVTCGILVQDPQELHGPLHISGSRSATELFGFKRQSSRARDADGMTTSKMSCRTLSFLPAPGRKWVLGSTYTSVKKKSHQSWRLIHSSTCHESVLTLFSGVGKRVLTDIEARPIVCDRDCTRQWEILKPEILSKGTVTIVQSRWNPHFDSAGEQPEM